MPSLTPAYCPWAPTWRWHARWERCKTFLLLSILTLVSVMQSTCPISSRFEAAGQRLLSLKIRHSQRIVVCGRWTSSIGFNRRVPGQDCSRQSSRLIVGDRAYWSFNRWPGREGGATARGRIRRRGSRRTVDPQQEEDTRWNLVFLPSLAGKVPLVIVPTSYPKLSFAEVAALNKLVSLYVVIMLFEVRFWIRRTFSRILEDGGIAGAEEDITPVSDIFALQGDAHMRKLEKKYLR